MSESTETVFITKYALTDGIKERPIVRRSSPDAVTVPWPGALNDVAYFWKKDWHRTREAAVARAEEMRKAKIASHEESIAKLQKLTFA